MDPVRQAQAALTAGNYEDAVTLCSLVGAEASVTAELTAIKAEALFRQGQFVGGEDDMLNLLELAFKLNDT